MCAAVVFCGQLEHDVDAAGAAFLPAVKRHVDRVGDEVRLPDALRVQLALAAEVGVLAAEAVRKRVGVVEDEIDVVELPQHRRRVRDRDIAGRLPDRCR